MQKQNTLLEIHRDTGSTNSVSLGWDYLVNSGWLEPLIPSHLDGKKCPNHPETWPTNDSSIKLIGNHHYLQLCLLTVVTQTV